MYIGTRAVKRTGAGEFRSQGLMVVGILLRLSHGWYANRAREDTVGVPTVAHVTGTRAMNNSGRPTSLPYATPQPRRRTPVHVYGAAGIAIGLCGIVWNVASVAATAATYNWQIERAQQRAVAQAAREMELTTNPPVRVIMAPEVRPGTGLIATVVLCTAVFALGAMLAILLVRGGWLLLRRSERAAGLHRLYVVAKFPLALLAGLAWWQILALNDPPARPVHVIGALIVVIVGWVYPAVLIPLLRQHRLEAPTAQG
jgi:hypothetical protein